MVPHINHLTNEIVTTHGSTVILACPSYGHPLPTYRWYKENRLLDGASEASTGRILQIDPLLVIRDTSLLDDGQYLCSINNSLGKEEDTVRLIVRCKCIKYTSDYTGVYSCILYG